MKTSWKYAILAFFAAFILFRLLSIQWSSFLVLDVGEGLFGSNEKNPVQSVREQILINQSQLVFIEVENTLENLVQWEDFDQHPLISSTGIGIGNDPAVEEILFKNRLELFFPDWLDRYSQTPPTEDSFDISQLAESAASELSQFLESPDSFGLEDYVLQDPLLLLPKALMALSPSATESTFRWVQLSESAFDPSVQEELIPIFSNKTDGSPWGGAIRFAATSRAEIKSEVRRINIVSALVVVAIVVFFLRRPSSLVHVTVPVLFALGGGLSLFSLGVRELHVISLILGSVLTGIAVDYGIHLFLHSKDQSRKELVRALLLSAASSIIGFALIAVTENPVIRDAGILVTLGLGAALLTGLLYPPLSKSHPEIRFVQLLSNKFPLPQIGPRILFVILWTFSLIGLWQISWKDDLRIMDIPHPKLETELRSFFQNNEMMNDPVIAVGDNYLDAIQVLDQAAPGGLISILPNPNSLERLKKFAPSGPKFIRELRIALDQQDIDSDLFDPFFNHLNSYLGSMAGQGDNQKVESVLALIAENLPAPLQFLMGSNGTQFWVGSMQKLQKTHPNVFLTSGENDLSSMMAGFRREFIGALLFGVAVVMIGLLVFLPRGDRLATLLPLFGSTLLTLGGIAWFQPLNLFHLVGLLLGGCIGLDYLIFYRTFRNSRGHFPISIRFSFFTTSGAFLTLLLSRIEAVYSLGIAVLLFITSVHLWIESDRNYPKNQNQ